MPGGGEVKWGPPPRLDSCWTGQSSQQNLKLHGGSEGQDSSRPRQIGTAPPETGGAISGSRLGTAEPERLELKESEPGIS